MFNESIGHKCTLQNPYCVSANYLVTTVACMTILPMLIQRMRWVVSYLEGGFWSWLKCRANWVRADSSL